jgi:hypothetical protein
MRRSVRRNGIVPVVSANGKQSDRLVGFVLICRPCGNDDLRLTDRQFNSDGIVHRTLKALLAAQVALSGFDENVSEGKLNLFELASRLMPEPYI